MTTLKQAIDDPQKRKQIALYLARAGVRNTELENIHAGEKNGGKGPGFDDELMKELMINVVDSIFTSLTILHENKMMVNKKTFIDCLIDTDLYDDWEEPHLLVFNQSTYTVTREKI